MLRDMTARQFTEWMVYAQLNPFDQSRADVRTAQVVQVLANAHRDRKQRRHPYTLQDCVVRFGDDKGPEPKRTQTMEQQKNILMAIARAYGAKARPAPVPRQGARVKRRTKGR